MLGAPVNQAMTDRSRLREAQLFQGSKGRLHRRLVVRNVAVRLCEDCLVCIMDPQMPVWQADALDRPCGEQRLGLIPELVQRELQRGRAAIQAENDMVPRSCTAVSLCTVRTRRRKGLRNKGLRLLLDPP